MSVDFSTVINALLGLCATALTILGGIALQAIAKKFNGQVSAQQVASFDDALGKSLMSGVTSSEVAIKAKGWDHIDVKNQVIGLAATALVAKFPDALAAVGLSTDLTDPKNAATIQAALQRALPAAFSVAAASPATPAVPNAVAVAAVASPAAA